MAENYSWLFVSGFAPETEPQDILNYLKSNNINRKCACEKMKTKNDKVRCSFRLGVPESLEKEINNGDMWPTGTIINNFMNVQSLTHRTKKGYNRPVQGN